MKKKKKQTEPEEPCPICRRKLRFVEDGWPWWQCPVSGKNHVFCGPDDDRDGRKVDRLIRKARKRDLEEHYRIIKELGLAKEKKGSGV